MADGDSGTGGEEIIGMWLTGGSGRSRLAVSTVEVKTVYYVSSCSSHCIFRHNMLSSIYEIFGGTYDMEYNSISNLNDNDKATLTSVFQGILTNLKHISVKKAIAYLRYIPEQCRLHHNSIENRKLRALDPKKYHPVKPKRGEIYNAFITEGVGSELCGNHLVVIVQNKKGNMYSEKVNVLPIEGDGSKINPNYQIQLTSSDITNGKLDKDPSRIIVTDIMSIDKARLDHRIACLTPECLESVNKLLRKHLEL